MEWSKLATLVLAAASGVCALLFPPASFILVPVATGLVGLATTHPADAAKQTTVSNQLTSALSALDSAQRAQVTK